MRLAQALFEQQLTAISNFVLNRKNSNIKLARLTVNSGNVAYFAPKFIDPFELNA
jgi:hypothetical protein